MNVESTFGDVVCCHGCSVACCFVTKLDVLQNYGCQLGAIREGTSWRQFLGATCKPFVVCNFPYGSKRTIVPNCPKLYELEFCL